MKYTLCLVAFLIVGQCFGQKKKSNDNTDENRKQLIEQIGDNRLKIDYLIDQYAKDTNDVVILRDLAVLYYQGNGLVQAYNICQLVLKKEKNDVFALRMTAGIFEKNNQVEEAILHYQKLLAVSETNQDYYQLASLYFKNENYKSCQHYLSKVLSKEAGDDKVLITFEKDKQTMNQMVAVHAAAYNMLGFVYMNQNEIEKAKEMCEIALKIDPNFELAKGNLAYLSSVKE